MVKEEADIEETEATWEDDTQTATNVLLISIPLFASSLKTLFENFHSLNNYQNIKLILVLYLKIRFCSGHF